MSIWVTLTFRSIPFHSVSFGIIWMMIIMNMDHSRNVVLTIAILWSSFLQLSLSNVQPKKPILIDSIFSQPDKLQLRFRPMGHYAASTFTSHVRIPFDYSALLKLQAQMIERMDRCIPDLDRFHFKIEERDLRVLNSTFELYKSDLNQVFKLFRDLLAPQDRVCFSCCPVSSAPFHRLPRGGSPLLPFH